MKVTTIEGICCVSRSQMCLYWHTKDVVIKTFCLPVCVCERESESECVVAVGGFG